MVEKLIELMKPYMDRFPCENESGSCEFVNCQECRGRELAEKLIENGVILPPCKVGDTVWVYNQSKEGEENERRALGWADETSI